MAGARETTPQGVTQITLRYFDACPNRRLAEERVLAVVAELGADRFELVHERIETPEDAARVGFRGSPTVLVDGRDPFPATGGVGLACRVYRTEAGVEGAPDVAALRRALAGRPIGQGPAG